MTFCPNCGACPPPGAPACPRCGKSTGTAAPPPRQVPPYQMPHPITPSQPVPPVYPPYPQQPAYPAYPAYQQRPAAPDGTNTLAVLGFVMALLPLPFAGLVLCVMGLIQCGQSGQKGRGLALAGIVLRLLAVAALIAGIAFFWYTMDIGDYYFPEYLERSRAFAFAML